MNYLKYIEFAAENLQFFLWYKDYASRWEQLKDSEKALSPEWTIPPEADMTIPPARPKRVPAQIAAVLKDTDFADAPKQPVERPDPFNTPPKSGSFDDKREFGSDYAMSMSDDKTLLSSTNSNNHQSVTNHAFDDAGMKWKPCKQSCSSSHNKTLMTRSHLPSISRRGLSHCQHIHRRR